MLNEQIEEYGSVRAGGRPELRSDEDVDADERLSDDDVGGDDARS